MHTNTSLATAPESHVVRDLVSVEHQRFDMLPNGQPSRRQFGIRSADFYACRHSANLLLRHRYSWRGYQAVSLPPTQTTNRITLTAVEDSRTIGTITVGLDGPEGMSCEDVFGAEIDALRASGRRVCEFTKLAVDADTSAKRILAGLFHVAYIVAHRIRGFDTLVMEVNPRHVRYYERMLGAQVIGAERMNRVVNAPAVLLSISFAYIMAQIGEHAGRPERAATERSLYPFAFTRSEEDRIKRLMSTDESGPAPAGLHDQPTVNDVAALACGIGGGDARAGSAPIGRPLRALVPPAARDFSGPSAARVRIAQGLHS